MKRENKIKSTVNDLDTELLRLLIISITIESVFPEETVVAIHLIIIIVINTFEGMHTRFVFWSLKSRRVCLKIVSNI